MPASRVPIKINLPPRERMRKIGTVPWEGKERRARRGSLVTAPSAVQLVNASVQGAHSDGGVRMGKGATAEIEQKGIERLMEERPNSPDS